jgi:hypothetical protein
MNLSFLDLGASKSHSEEVLEVGWGGRSHIQSPTPCAKIGIP